MSDSTPRGPGPTPISSAQPLIERVRARVADAGRNLDQRTRGSRPGAKVRRGQRSETELPTSSGTDGERDARCLRLVFHELGDTHRVHRSRTGQRVPVGLRDAARAFKQAPSVASLAAVAAFLERDGILEW